MLNSIFDDLSAPQASDPVGMEAALLRQIDSIKEKMKLAEELFDLSDDEALTDACIYQIKALGSYYRYLLAEAKRTGCCREAPSKPAPVLRAAGLL